MNAKDAAKPSKIAAVINANTIKAVFAVS